MSRGKVLVCGGRDYSDRRKVYAILDRLHSEDPIWRIVAGGANGADALACDWAAMRSIGYIKYPADWETLGRKAGPLRNREMLERETPHLVVAFPGGPGTANMIKLATDSLVPVMIA